MASWTTKVNERAAGGEAAISGEGHTIGEDTAGVVFLSEVPLQEAPSSVSIPGYTEVTGPPAAGQFRVTYSGRLAGAVEFHPGANGANVSVTYKGRGSSLLARDLNRLQSEKLDRDGALAMTGALTLAGDPTQPNHAARKGYVDSAVAGVQGQTLVGLARNLVVKQASASTVTITADEVWLEDGTGGFRRFTAVSETANIATTGADGLDTGSEAANTWYAVWLIGKADGTIDSLLSTSATAPSLPAGYTHKARVGWVRNDGSSNFVKFIQFGRKAHYAINTTPTSGTNLGTTLSPVDLSAHVPSTATHALLSVLRVSGTSPNHSVFISWDNSSDYIRIWRRPDPGIEEGGFEIPLATAQTTYWRENIAVADTYDMNCWGWIDNIAAP